MTFESFISTHNEAELKRQLQTTTEALRELEETRAVLLRELGFMGVLAYELETPSLIAFNLDVELNEATDGLEG